MTVGEIVVKLEKAWERRRALENKAFNTHLTEPEVQTLEILEDYIDMLTNLKVKE